MLILNRDEFGNQELDQNSKPILQSEHEYEASFSPNKIKIQFYVIHKILSYIAKSVKNVSKYIVLFFAYDCS